MTHIQVPIDRGQFDAMREMAIMDGIQAGPSAAIAWVLAQYMESRPELAEIATAVNKAAAKARDEARAALKAKQ